MDYFYKGRKKLLIKKIFIVCIIVLFLFISINPSIAFGNLQRLSISIKSVNTLYVGGTGPDNYTKIQDAIDNASDGDTILVFDDSSPYFENILINKSIRLVGQNTNTTIINGNFIDDVLIIFADYVFISNLTFINCGKDNFDAGIEINSDYNTIFNNTLHDNEGESQISGGIFINSSFHNEIYSNIIYDNEYDGITLINSDHNHIFNNKIFNNKRLGITLRNSSCNLIENNSVIENFCGICLYPHSTYNTVKMNYFYNHPCCGIALKKFSDYNLIQYNHVIDNLGHGIMLGPGPTCRNTVEGNTISGCTFSPWQPNGAIVLQLAFFNTIKKNNIFDNLLNVNLNSSFFNQWLNNYWDNYLGFGPKIIVGRVYLPIKSKINIPWFNIDWNPASEPYGYLNI